MAASNSTDDNNNPLNQIYMRGYNDYKLYKPIVHTTLNTIYESERLKKRNVVSHTKKINITSQAEITSPQKKIQTSSASSDNSRARLSEIQKTKQAYAPHNFPLSPKRSQSISPKNTISKEISTNINTVSIKAQTLRTSISPKSSSLKSKSPHPQKPTSPKSNSQKPSSPKFYSQKQSSPKLSTSKESSTKSISSCSATSNINLKFGYNSHASSVSKPVSQRSWSNAVNTKTSPTLNSTITLNKESNHPKKFSPLSISKKEKLNELGRKPSYIIGDRNSPPLKVVDSKKSSNLIKKQSPSVSMQKQCTNLHNHKQTTSIVKQHNGPAVKKTFHSFTKISPTSADPFQPKEGIKESSLEKSIKSEEYDTQPVTPKNSKIERRSLSSKHNISKPNSKYIPITDRQLQTFIDKSSANGKLKQIKNLIQEAITRKKIFTVFGRSSIIRNELKKRGWVEKLSNSMLSLIKKQLPANERSEQFISSIQNIAISKMLQKYPPNLVWMLKGNLKVLNNFNMSSNPLINRLRLEDNHFTSKEGLCTSLKDKYWFYIDGVSEVNAPRSYNIFNEDEINDFTSDYRITACTSLLQWFVNASKGDEKKLISKEGKINLTVIFFALKRCQTYILCKEHRDIDRIIKDPKQMDWNNFLENFQKLITRQEHFKEENTNAYKIFIECSNIVLKYMIRYRPQLECEGNYNIWIVKPAHWSRGKGIVLANDIKKILNTSTQPGVKKYVVQKYIEMPLLVYDTKFDIRQYYIVTSTYPLVIWMYKNCYLRFSSQKYSLHNFHESIHLTNNAIQHRYKNCSARHPNLPKNNMWSLEQFMEYLERVKNKEVWDTVIYPGMRKNIVGAMLSCQEGMNKKKNNFEFYGCDFILDSKYRPWLIEINSCPDMSGSTKVTAKICPEALQDLIKVVIDYRNNYHAPTGHFECIYSQRMTNPVNNSDTSALILRGEHVKSAYFWKGPNIKEYQYKDAGIKELNSDTPLRYVLQKLESDSLLHEIPSVEETMVHQYRSSITTLASFQNEDIATPVQSLTAINSHIKSSTDFTQEKEDSMTEEDKKSESKNEEIKEENTSERILDEGIEEEKIEEEKIEEEKIEEKIIEQNIVENKILEEKNNNDEIDLSEVPQIIDHANLEISDIHKRAKKNDLHLVISKNKRTKARAEKTITEQKKSSIKETNVQLPETFESQILLKPTSSAETEFEVKIYESTSSPYISAEEIDRTPSLFNSVTIFDINKNVDMFNEKIFNNEQDMLQYLENKKYKRKSNHSLYSLRDISKNIPKPYKSYIDLNSNDLNFAPCLQVNTYENNTPSTSHASKTEEISTKKNRQKKFMSRVARKFASLMRKNKLKNVQ